MGNERCTVDFCMALSETSLVTMVTVFGWMVLKTALLMAPCSSQVCPLGLESGSSTGRKCLLGGEQAPGDRRGPSLGRPPGGLVMAVCGEHNGGPGWCSGLRRQVDEGNHPLAGGGRGGRLGLG